MAGVKGSSHSSDSVGLHQTLLGLPPANPPSIPPAPPSDLCLVCCGQCACITATCINPRVCPGFIFFRGTLVTRSRQPAQPRGTPDRKTRAQRPGCFRPTSGVCLGACNDAALQHPYALDHVAFGAWTTPTSGVCLGACNDTPYAFAHVAFGAWTTPTLGVCLGSCSIAAPTKLSCPPMFPWLLGPHLPRVCAWAHGGRPPSGPAPRCAHGPGCGHKVWKVWGV